MDSLLVQSPLLRTDDDVSKFKRCVRLLPQETGFDFDPEEDVELESCFPLSIGGGSGDDARLTLSSGSGSFFRRLVLVSQAKRLEIFAGRSQQYLKTVHGSFVEDARDENGGGDDDDLVMYKVDVELSEGEASEDVSIRLPSGAGGPGSVCWVMGLYLRLVAGEGGRRRSRGGTAFDVEAVDRWIGDRDGLTDSARRFKTMFDAFQKSRAASCPMTAAGLLNPSLGLPGNEARPCPGCAGSLEAMEGRIVRRIDEMEKRQGEKLDRLLELLSRPG